jgi:hypothetical protein
MLLQPLMRREVMNEVRELIDTEIMSEVHELIDAELDAVCGGSFGEVSNLINSTLPRTDGSVSGIKAPIIITG